MGTSAFDPIALADTRSVKNKITHSGITGDVLSVGDVIRWDPISDLYVLARANNQTNSNFVGVIESINATDFTIVYSGEISLPDSLMTTISGSSGSYILYLSDTNAGKLTATAPSAPGSVIKPVIIISGTTDDNLDTLDGVVVNTVGDAILGDSSVDLSDIQPVGSILAFAGKTGDIPAGWEICDGGFLGVTAYSDLYAALDDGKLYGFIQNVTLEGITGSGSGILSTQNIVGTTIVFAKVGQDINLEGTILSGTPNSTGSVLTNVEIYIDPLINGEHHNLQLEPNDVGNPGVGIQLYRVSSATKVKFKKPDLRARFIIGDSRGLTGEQVSGFNEYTVGLFGGEEEHSLTDQEIPFHSHGLTFSGRIDNANITATHNLSVGSAGSHRHPNMKILPGKGFVSGDRRVYVDTIDNLEPMPLSSDHTHNPITGQITINAQNLVPVIDAQMDSFGGGLAHNNVPQHMVAIWIIKTRKDSVAKLFRLGPSGGGAIIAKNTAKRWARMSQPGAGCTIDSSYGTWIVSRLGTGDYRFTHDLLSELGTADQDKYIVEATVVKNGSGATQMFVANPYGLGGISFGVRIYEIMGATFSDNFQYLGLSVYGGGTAL